MRGKVVGALALTISTAALASCGRPDNSGIFVSTADREVTLIQLVQTKDGHLTGRFEDVSINAGGAVNDIVTTIDGAASQDELTLMFKPLSFLNAGFSATGKVSGDTLILTARGLNITAKRASLESYQTAIQHIQATAAVEQKKAADAQAAEQARLAELRAAQQARDEAARARAAEAARLQAISDKDGKLVTATADLRRQTALLDTALAAVPDYRHLAEANSEKVARMLRTAPGLSPVDRSQLAVDGNQVVIATHQLEIDRNQKRIEANQIVQSAATLAVEIAKFCSSLEGSQHARSCKAANPAVAGFQTSLSHGKALFATLGQRIKDNTERQQRMVSQIRSGAL